MRKDGGQEVEREHQDLRAEVIGLRWTAGFAPAVLFASGKLIGWREVVRNPLVTANSSRKNPSPKADAAKLG
jgi:hypothetical protein